MNTILNLITQDLKNQLRKNKNKRRTNLRSRCIVRWCSIKVAPETVSTKCVNISVMHVCVFAHGGEPRRSRKAGTMKPH